MVSVSSVTVIRCHAVEWTVLVEVEVQWKIKGGELGFDVEAEADVSTFRIGAARTFVTMGVGTLEAGVLLKTIDTATVLSVERPVESTASKFAVWIELFESAFDAVLALIDEVAGRMPAALMEASKW